MKQFLKNFIILVIVLLVLAGVVSSFQINKPKNENVNYTTLVSQISEGKVKKIDILGDRAAVTLNDGTEEIVLKENQDSLSTTLKNFGVGPEELKKIPIEVKNDRGASYWVGTLLPFLLPILFVGLLLWFMARQVSGANARALGFGQSTARETKPEEGPKVTFADVAGMKESKQELEEVVEFLKNPKRFTEMGAKIPKGVLLMGPPGSGKTLLARAVAGQAGVPFLHMSGSEFVEMFVGVGASRVRSLFQRAKKIAPAIVFIDEIDAVGRRRGAGLGGSHDEREQTLNQILVEMDGFEPNSGVIVISATNRPDVLDPALLRPGRFDRRVTIILPDINEREEILKIHAKNKPLAEEVSLRVIAERTPGFSGADLANLLNEASILAVRREKTQVATDEILESIEKVLLGPERRSHVISEKERRITAYHEAGHALVSHALPRTDPIRKLSIISRGHAGGYTLKMPTEDKHFHTRGEMREDIAMALGGYVAEISVFGADELSTGPSSDLRMATKLARQYVMDFGMSDVLAPRTYGEHEEMIFLGREITEQRDYSEKMAERIDAEIEKLVSEARAEAARIVKDYRVGLDRLAQELLKRETLEQGEFEKIMKEEGVEKPVV
ncbi:MAG: ATP-dependent metalloprotease FtsH [Candidatus Magasanikbacteria bacterium]|nr:ATP-dependent metalloprotease FtsH [Candidatus Magasanikbacteria bacterium]